MDGTMKAMSLRFVALLVLMALFIFQAPAQSRAVDTEANKQCPAGGAVGDPCKDVTNGYVTKGHCVYIGWCKADQYNIPPPKGTGSSGGAPSAPPAEPQYQATAPHQQYSDYYPVDRPSFVVTVTSNASPGDIVRAAYQVASPLEGGAIGTADGRISSASGASGGVADVSSSGFSPYVRYLNLNGSEYLVTSEAVLEVGTPLQDISDAAQLPENFDTNALNMYAQDRLAASGAGANTANSPSGQGSGEISGGGDSSGTPISAFIDDVLHTGIGGMFVSFFGGNSGQQSEDKHTGAVAEAPGETISGGNTFTYVQPGSGTSYPDVTGKGGTNDIAHGSRYTAVGSPSRRVGDTLSLVKDHPLISIVLLSILVVLLVSVYHFVMKALYPPEPLQMS